MILFGVEVLVTQDMTLLDHALDALRRAKIPYQYSAVSSSSGGRGFRGRMSFASGCYDFYQIKVRRRDLERAQFCIAQAQKERR